MSRLAKMSDGVLNDLKNRINGLGDQADERLGLKGDNPQAGEIRAVLRGMDNKAKREAFKEAVKNGDSELIGAVLSASNPLLLGVDKNQMKQWRDLAESELLPDLVQFREAAEYSVDLLQDSFTAAVNLVDNVAGTREEVRADQAQIDAARKAESALSEALSE